MAVTTMIPIVTTGSGSPPRLRANARCAPRWSPTCFESHPMRDATSARSSGGASFSARR
jgi:hypothetical protein